MSGNLESVKFLVEQHGADVNATNEYGETPLQCARKQGIRDYLISKGEQSEQKNELF